MNQFMQSPENQIGTSIMTAITDLAENLKSTSTRQIKDPNKIILTGGIQHTNSLKDIKCINNYEVF